MTTQDPATPSKETRNLVRVLDHHAIDLVLDVGANVGQYASRLRQGGWRGRIVSFEPLPQVHATLDAAAASDPDWTVAPPLALGDRDGTITINVSAESDMSSSLPLRPEMASLLDSAAYTGAQTVAQRRLDGLLDDFATPDERVFLKIDTQGTEQAVLAGATGALHRLYGIQMELAVVPVYQGEPGWLETIDRLDRLGFVPTLFIPGYFNRRTARLMSMDGVFVRRDAG